MARVLEIRAYTLKAGTGPAFLQLMTEAALPLLERWQVDVVAYGASLHDADSCYLIRAFASLEDRERTEDAFYGSSEWRQGPREAILALIDRYSEVVLEMDAAMIDALRIPLLPDDRPSPPG
ncbi:MAG TPA: NIPSNAP family protein [Chloroflexia bacterium]|nr:NIPSNAP family protein [Chloroflexia bacterium]